MNTRHILVAGGGGFIGGHLVKTLIEAGNHVRSVDIKPRSEWQQHFPQADNRVMNLQELGACRQAVQGEIGRAHV